jgi:hypothetical protein
MNRTGVKDFINHFGCLGAACIIGLLMMLVGIIGKIIQLC